MNIIYLTSSLAVRGGIERTLIDKANFLAEKGHQMFFITYEQGNHPVSYPLNPSIRHIDIDCKEYPLHKYAFLLHLNKLWHLKKEFRLKWNTLVDDIQPEVVITTTNSIAFIKEIVSVRKKAPIVVESHLSFGAQKQSHSFLGRLWWMHHLIYIKRCDLLIALTEGDAVSWRRYVKNVRKVANPVTRYIDDPFSVKRGSNRIIGVGRLNNHQKRFDRLIDAFYLISSKYPQWHLDIYGDGELRTQMMQQIKRLSLEKKVALHPAVSDIYAEYLRSDLFVLSSDYEGFGLVIVEAMSCGTPVISTDCPFGPSEIIEDGVTGLLCKMEVADIANKIEWMISHEAERHIMAVKGHQSASKYKLEIVMNNWENAYVSVKR